jgi:hypothetical protein
MKKLEKVNLFSNLVIIKLLNYTVDLNLIYHFTKALIIIAEFYFQCGKTHESLFYYNEAK